VLPCLERVHLAGPDSSEATPDGGLGVCKDRGPFRDVCLLEPASSALARAAHSASYASAMTTMSMRMVVRTPAVSTIASRHGKYVAENCDVDSAALECQKQR